MALDSSEKGRGKGGSGVRAEAALEIFKGGRRATHETGRARDRKVTNNTNLGEGCFFEPLGSYIFGDLVLGTVGDRYCFPSRFVSN